MKIHSKKFALLATLCLAGTVATAYALTILLNLSIPVSIIAPPSPISITIAGHQLQISSEPQITPQLNLTAGSSFEVPLAFNKTCTDPISLTISVSSTNPHITVGIIGAEYIDSEGGFDNYALVVPGATEGGVGHVEVTFSLSALDATVGEAGIVTLMVSQG